ncbi:sulfite exporter TauE/SafE family protein [Streptomonospora sediminis]
MTAAVLGLGGCAIVCGAAAQRVTGLGFALVAAPFLVLAAGPGAGVGVANLLSAVLCALVLVRTRHGLDRRRAVLMAVPALAGVPLGVAVQHRVPEGPLMVLVGVLAGAAVLLVTVSRRAAVLRGRPGALAAGALSGFMNASAGLGGPPVALHAQSERWSAEVLVPTSQLFLLAVNIASLAARGWPPFPPAVLAGAVVLVAAGAALGGRIAGCVSVERTRALMLAIALLGAAVGAVRGAVLWSGAALW